MNYSKDRKFELLKQRIISKLSAYETTTINQMNRLLYEDIRDNFGRKVEALETQIENHESWFSDMWEILTHEKTSTIKDLIEAVGEELFMDFVYDTEQYDLAFKVLDVDFIYWLGESHELRGLKEHPISGYDLKVKELYIKYKSKYPDGLTNGFEFVFPK
jgi:hypothetical protein